MTEAQWLAEYNAKRNAKRKATIEAKQAAAAERRAKYATLGLPDRENLAELIYNMAPQESPFHQSPKAPKAPFERQAEA